MGWAKSRGPLVPGKKFNRLQILGCELHKNAFGVGCGIRWGAIALPRPSSHYKGERKEGRGGKNWK